MALDEYHLTKKGDDWRLEKAGSNRAVVKAETKAEAVEKARHYVCLLYTSPSPRDRTRSRMPSSA